jgi:hypothetical protein
VIVGAQQIGCSDHLESTCSTLDYWNLGAAFSAIFGKGGPMARDTPRKTSIDDQIGRWIKGGEAVGNVLFRLAEMCFVIGIFFLAWRLTHSSVMSFVATILIGAMTIYLLAICWNLIGLLMPKPRFEGYAILWLLLAFVMALAVAVGLALTIKGIVNSETMKLFLT